MVAEGVEAMLRSDSGSLPAPLLSNGPLSDGEIGPVSER